MRPFLDSGNWVGVEWLNQDDMRMSPKLGELVLCRNQLGTWVLHRVIATPLASAFSRRGANPEKRPQKSWMVKGDASFVAENFTSAELWGRVVAFRRGEDAPMRPWRCRQIDRWIAYCSRQTLVRTRIEAALFRRAVRGLSWIRRLSF